MDSTTQTVITIVGSVIASGGFWGFVTHFRDRKDITKQMLIGLAHDRIIYLGMCYIERGWISADEYENLCEYLYAPYKKMGGNGSADRIMAEVNKLEIRRLPLLREKD